MRRVVDAAGLVAAVVTAAVAVIAATSDNALFPVADGIEAGVVQRLELAKEHFNICAEHSDRKEALSHFSAGNAALERAAKEGSSARLPRDHPAFSALDRCVKRTAEDLAKR